MIDFIFFFFFKQKTAYEMRISDWSSDVCSSDLLARAATTRELVLAGSSARPSQCNRLNTPVSIAISTTPTTVKRAAWPINTRIASPTIGADDSVPMSPCRHRSEEHTSELQSLMRISYAVFCLKKKQQQKSTQRN